MVGGARDSWWWAELPDAERARTRRPLDGDTDVDVAIVGAGYTGLWTAHSLLRADPSRRVLVLEREQVGAGASGRNGGWCSALLPIGWAEVARHHGRDAALALQAAVDATLDEIEAVLAAEGIDAHWARGGYLRTASDRAQLARLDDELADARSWGRTEADLRRLGADEARAVIAAPRALGALFTPHCAAVQPLRLARGLADAVERRGGRIVERTTALTVAPGQVETDRGTVRAEVVVRATEGYTGGLPGAERELLPVYSVLVATEPLDDATWADLGWRQRETWNDASRDLFYAQRTADGRIAWGGRGAPYRLGGQVADPLPDLERLRVRLHTRLVDQLPQLRSVRLTHRWAGVLGVPRDWMPTVAFDRSTGLAAAGGYSGDGVALAGRTLADLIGGEDTDLTRLPLVGHRRPRWEPEPFRWLGVAAGEQLAAAADRSEARRQRPSGVFGRAYARLTAH